ncbi:hypothetical protein [Pantoea agglomerans]
MNNLTVSDINADVSMLMESFKSDDRNIPSPVKIFKVSITVPVIALFFSFISILSVYLTVYTERATLDGFFEYVISEGWAVVVPTVIIGLFILSMTYNNIMMYMSIPKEVRVKSIILSHLRKITKRTVTAFMLLMLIASLLTTFSFWLAFAIPALECVFLFAVSLIVSAEINRLGAGIALEKISKLISKI